LISPATTDLLERRAINVVEEMAIAAGLPVPPVYVLRDEQGINAFAAGWSPDDAVVGITQGALEGLSREQLQGVVAHEFSHVLNRDCALNMKLLGVLNGIVVISLIGRVLFRLGGSTGGGRRNKGLPQIMIVGGVIWLFGSVGVLVARLIQAAVAKQREFLADASAVQFTRNPEGIAGALATIGAQGSALESAHAAEAGHMLIGEAGKMSFLGAFDSHPPLDVRIKRIIPQWNGDFSTLATPPGMVERTLEEGSERKAHAAARSVPSGLQQAVAIGSAALQAASVSAPLVHSAANLLANIPGPLRTAAADPFSARALILAWVMDDQNEERMTQFALLGGDPALAAETERLLRQLPSLDPLAVLPLFDLAVGTLAGLSPKQASDFFSILQTLQAQLSHDAYQSYCLSAVALRHLQREKQKRPARPILIKDAIEVVLGVLAIQGQNNAEDAQKAFAAGVSKMGDRAQSLRLRRPQDLSVQGLKEAFETLFFLPHATRAEILNVAEAIAGYDGVVRLREAELLRAMASCLNLATKPAFASAA
jgi:Zn-dependent protease with chaperone function